MSKKPAPAIHFIDNDGNLHINGSNIQRHPEKPWLFSANDVRASIKDRILKIGAKRIQKADEREEAGESRGRAPKTPEDFFVEKAPSSYIKVAKKSTELLSCYAKAIRKQAKEDIIGLCGSRRMRIRLLQLHGFGKASEVRTFILGLDNEELCYKVQNGNTENRGVWLCHQMIVDYASFLSPKFHAQVTQAFIEIASLNTEALEKRLNSVRIAKGTETRKENIQLNHEFVAECGKKKILPMKAQEGLNIGVLGMTATKYKKKYGIPEPLNDNLPVRLVDVKNIGLVLATSRLREDSRAAISNKEGREIGINSGITARMIFENEDLKTKINEYVMEERDRMKDEINS